MKLYHGTNRDFDAFDLRFFGHGSSDGGWLGFGVYLTNDREYAASYGDVLECEVELKNPYVLTDHMYSRQPERLNKEMGTFNSRLTTKKLKELGHDGVMLTYDNSEFGGPDDFVEVCVFDPQQIKILNRPKMERRCRPIFTTIWERKIHLILEAANSFRDLTEDCVLVTFNNKKECKLCLYDAANSKALAYITGYRAAGSIWQLDRIAAEKGWGPLMNDIFLMFLNPDLVQPATMIKPDALNMWKFYYDRRSDVTKVPLPTGHPNHAQYYVDSEGAPEVSDADDMRIINTLYTMEKTAEYKRLVARSEVVLGERRLSRNAILKSGFDLFWDKYGVPAKAA